MAQPAAHAVLNTVELLEAILLNVDTKTLLLSQRTCKTWQKVIAASILLQEVLFFRPAPESLPPDDAATGDAKPDAANPVAANADTVNAGDADRGPIFNPLARKAFQLRKLKPGQPNTKVKGQSKEYVNPWIAGSFRRIGTCPGDETIVARGGEHVTIGDILDKLEKLSGGKPHKARATVVSALVGERFAFKSGPADIHHGTRNPRLRVDFTAACRREKEPQCTGKYDRSNKPFQYG